MSIDDRINKLLNKRNISKRDIFKKWTELNSLQDVGGAFFNRIRSYLPDINTMAVEFGGWTLVLKSFGIDNWKYIIIGYLLVRFYLWMIINYTLGRKIRKWELLKVQNEWQAKEQNFNPWNQEMKEQLIEIANKVGADVKFKEL
ncbi:MAG: hypothetical protein KGL39_45990 [Patescibacteria group bacterium]|nr:hypothetical protein [Patescibacteria group bacterium]